MPLLLLLFIVVPLVELYVIVQVGQQIGVLWTLGLLLADSILGSVLMRSQGRAAWRRFREALAAGRPPAREVVDGALVILGGALLLTPGFVTDLAGLALLAPPTRAIIRRTLLRGVLARLMGPAGIPVSAAFRSAARRPPSEPFVDGTARDVDPDRLP